MCLDGGQSRWASQETDAAGDPLRLCRSYRNQCHGEE